MIMDDLRSMDTDAFYQRVLPQLEKLEIVRNVKLASYHFRRRIGIPLAIVLTPICAALDFLLLLWQRGNDDSGAGITFVVLGALYWWVTQPKREYAAAYKKDILPEIAKLFGNLRYVLNGKIPMAELEPSKIIPSHNRYQTDDYFIGEYKGVKITISEMTLKRKSGSGKNSRVKTVFKGLTILIAMPRQKFHGHTVLMQDVNRFGKWFQKQATGLKHADLVDPQFEKVFDVFTNDQVEARYLVDPTMIENLKTMRDVYNAESFSAAYFNNQILVMLPSRHNYFEPANIGVPATDPQTIVSMKEELALVLNLVDYLEVYDAVSLHRAQNDGALPPGMTAPPDEKPIPGIP